MQKVYENIKSLRKAAKMTQEELAQKAGYTDRSSIAKIESGQVDLPQSKITLFAQIFGISVESMLGLDQPSHTYDQITLNNCDLQLFSEQKNKPIHEDGLSERQKKFMQFLETVPDEKVDRLIRIMQSILENDL